MKCKNLKIKGIAVVLVALSMTVFSCKETPKEQPKKDMEASEVSMKAAEPFFKLSLAQWSMHKMVREDGVDPYTFAEKAKKWGFTGLEYVSGLYYKELEAANFSKEAMAAFVEKSNAESKKHGMQNVLIMIDGQGDLATTDAKKRKEAVENHYKWVDAAAAMGCHAIRVNLSGSKVPNEWVASSVDGLTQLATYAKGKNIEVLVENHGGLSSNAVMLAEVMTKVNMENCGTLPDFGNFCIERTKDGCAEEYDIYKGISELMPHALAVSAKSYDFDAEGNETKLDYPRILKIVKDAGYTGYIGVEYEGSRLSEEEGILATRDLLIKAGKELN
ncbi:sugar phosphate isomerase/epimerase [Arenibacter sp. BSSL-BM3]|uniref:Sugar phosphate isomerase/epimerase n=1 Tax=Arenibacter arenosicollis TaxID=2762274 RepID=A0ABR7QKF3_9FLAO|nr:sugar phosphate isomerase/epimerase family protein [Arenibacter arenosicollis]MBC8767415.1 sugar phosphate isomerase/epimerase [Arenibacter arenosicollis]